MRFDDVAVICDLDYLFCHDIKNLNEIGSDEQYPNRFRQHIEWVTEEGSPPLEYRVQKLEEKGESPEFARQTCTPKYPTKKEMR